MGKTEILKSHYLNYDKLHPLSKEEIFKAMDEYAAQQSAEFAIWMFDEINPFMKHEGKWIQACGNSTSWTTEQLYGIFLSQQKKKV